ncbi:MAG: XdhC family protein [Polyangiaceae bacterium]
MAKPVEITRMDDKAPRLAPRSADATDVLEVAVGLAKKGIGGAMATVVARHGSAPSTPGQKLYVAEDDTCVGTVGGGAVEREVIDALDAMLRGACGKDAPKGGDARHEMRSFKLGAELGMCCGGSVDILLEPIDAQMPCLIVGGGHVATAVAPLLAKIGFAVTVCDSREAWGEDGRIPNVTCVVGEHDDVGKDFPTSGACLVMTHDHGLDQDVIEWAMKKKFAYVGGVGSRAKAQRTRDRLEAKGFPESDRTRLKMPIGVDIGARLPHEIAVSIAAELVAWRRAPKNMKRKT